MVLDTNVLVAALRSRAGASFGLLQLVGTGRFDVVLSVPLLLEYEDVLSRPEHGIPGNVAEPVLDYLCSVAIHHKIFFLWRPFLPDARDDMLAELAFSAQARFVITHNTRDFEPLPQLGIHPVTPSTFLKRVRHR